MPEGALSGLLVLEFGAVLAGPFCAQLLAEMGADVVKVEPLAGARGRTTGLNYVANRSKRSIALDMSRPAGMEIARSLIARADVLIENFRPGRMARMGLGFEDVEALNQRIVYCSLSGYGERGPFRDLPGQDLLAQALSGLVSITGPGSAPSPAGTFLGDIGGGIMAALGILAALQERTRSGRGQHVKTSLLSNLLNLQSYELTGFLTSTSARLPGRVESGHFMFGPVYGVFRCRDGELVIGSHALPPLARCLGCEDQLGDLLAADPDELADVREEVRAVLESAMANRSRDELVADLTAAGVWSMPVLGYPELAGHPQLWENEMLASYDDPRIGTVTVPAPPIEMSRTPGRIRSPWPEIGEHTSEILAGHLGLSQESIGDLRASGVVGGPG
jgi:crotonobetainyl-CoA:carnitine CoA-transferase CaiB-like acyl-CoA transferase